MALSLLISVVLLTAPWSVILSSPKAAVASNALDRMSGFPDRPNVFNAPCLDIINLCEKEPIISHTPPTNSRCKFPCSVCTRLYFDIARSDIDVQIDNIGMYQGRGFGTP